MMKPKKTFKGHKKALQRINRHAGFRFVIGIPPVIIHFDGILNYRPSSYWDPPWWWKQPYQHIYAYPCAYLCISTGSIYCILKQLMSPSWSQTCSPASTTSSQAHKFYRSCHFPRTILKCQKELVRLGARHVVLEAVFGNGEGLWHGWSVREIHLNLHPLDRVPSH